MGEKRFVMVDSDRETKSADDDMAPSDDSKTATASLATGNEFQLSKIKSDVAEATNDDVGNTNASPLFSLVTAASQLLDKDRKEEEENEGKAGAGIERTEESHEETGKKSEEKNVQEGSQSVATEKKTESNSEITKEPTDSSVLKGTKEDLIRNPNQKPTFAEQLYDILENEEHHDVLQWMPDGKAFTVVNHKKFTLYKMATLFNIRNMSSFVRKLGRWGFSRVHEKQSNNSDIFRHPDFKRGERATVKRKVRCMGRLLAAGIQQQQQGAGAGPSNAYGMSGALPYHTGARAALRREADFVLPMTSQGPLMEGTLPFHEGQAVNEAAAPPSVVIEPTLERVTDASAASAEALYLSHRQFQQAKMEQLVRDQQELNDRELHNLLRQREQQQRELEAQKRRIIMEQQQLQEAALRSAAMTQALPDNRAHPSLSSMRRTLPEMQHQDVSRMLPQGSSSGLVRPGTAASVDLGPHPQDYPVVSQNPRVGSGTDQHGILEEQQQLQQMMALQERRALMDQTQHSLDDSLPRSIGSVPTTLSRHLTGGSSIDSRMLSSPSAPLNHDETRAQQRKAVIQALLQEEQEWEMKRRVDASFDQSQHSVQSSLAQHRSPLPDEAWTTAREAQLHQLEQMKAQQQQQQQQHMMLMQQQQQQQLLKQQHLQL